MSDLPADGPYGRDVRIDFFRGLALYIILVDHIEFNPLSKLTYQRFGFSDAAEIFVFVSGLSCGIVYHSILKRRGLPGLFAGVIKRASLIYVYYVLSSIATIWLIRVTAKPILKSATLDGSFFTNATSPFSAIWSAILLVEQQPFPGILVLYMVLTLFVIPAFLIGAKRSAALAVAISGCIWMIPQFHRPGPVWPTLFPYFNPVAWQFLFSIGMFFGIRYRSGGWQQARWTPMLKWAFVAAWAIVILSLLYRVLPFLASSAGLNSGWLRPHELSSALSKYNLSIFRLAHFLSVAFLVRTYVNANNPALRWGNDLIIKTGRWPLQIFSMGAILSVIVTVFFSTYSLSLPEKLAFNFAVIFLTALAAVALSNYAKLTTSMNIAPNSAKTAGLPSGSRS
jgi:hypothetical protein